jgi:hypothetical protein
VATRPFCSSVFVPARLREAAVPPRFVLEPDFEEELREVVLRPLDLEPVELFVEAPDLAFDVVLEEPFDEDELDFDDPLLDDPPLDDLLDPPDLEPDEADLDFEVPDEVDFFDLEELLALPFDPDELPDFVDLDEPPVFEDPPAERLDLEPELLDEERADFDDALPDFEPDELLDEDLADLDELLDPDDLLDDPVLDPADFLEDEADFEPEDFFEVGDFDPEDFFVAAILFFPRIH